VLLFQAVGPYKAFFRGILDCIVTGMSENREMMSKALDCYVMYQNTIAASGVKEGTRNQVYFEIFGEDHKSPLQELTDKL
jgi:hypothetical protein